MSTLFLELYQGKIPSPFNELPGADHYDESQADLYWSVLIPAPAPGSDAAAFIAPLPGSDPVAGFTHGTDTLSAAATSFTAETLGIWRPKEPPYAFRVIAPSGEQAALEPPDGGDETTFHVVPAPGGEHVGVWVVAVARLAASELPAEFPPRQARLNPELLDLAGNFARQPLLRVEGEEKRRGQRCADIDSVVVVAGCAPGDVEFEATITNPGDVEALTWNFGDGEEEDGDVDGTGSAQKTHTYVAAGTAEEPLIATVTVLRHEECSARLTTDSVVVPACPVEVDCPQLQSVEVLGIDPCAPGEIEFRATATRPELVEAWTWNFDDAAGDVSGGAEITHTFAERRTHDVTVTILRPPGCSPRTQTLEVEVPPCPGPPPPCEPVPEDYALRVFDTEGNEITGDECVPAGQAEIVAPEHEGSVGWRVDGDDMPPDAALPRRLRVDVEPGEEHTIEATVGERECRRPVTRVIRGCEREPPPPPSEESLGCAILRIAALAFLILGLVLTVAGVATNNPALCAVGVILALVGAVLLALWAWWCATDASCSLLQGVIIITQLIMWLTLIVGLVGLVIDPACVVILVNEFIFGLVLARVLIVFMQKECEWVPGPFDFLIVHP